VQYGLSLQDEINVPIAGFSQLLCLGNPKLRPILSQKQLKNESNFAVFDRF
jgi:hypothetical protein